MKLVDEIIGCMNIWASAWAKDGQTVGSRGFSVIEIAIKLVSKEVRWHQHRINWSKCILILFSTSDVSVNVCYFPATLDMLLHCISNYYSKKGDQLRRR